MILWSVNATFNDLRWTAFKALLSSKSLLPLMQYELSTDGSHYLVWVPDDDNVFIRTNVLIGVSSDIDDSYTQQQANADQTDFETNFKPNCNGPLILRSSDGRAVVRTTTASKTRNFNLKVFSFLLGDSGSLKNLDINFSSLSDVTMTCYDVNGATTTDPTQAVKTILDWEPSYNYEIIGGWIDIPGSIAGGTTGNWWVTCIGVPDVPAAYGGSVPFVYPTNLEAAYSQKVFSDGRATQYLKYDAVHHTNKLRWIFKHPISAVAHLQIYLEIFI